MGFSVCTFGVRTMDPPMCCCAAAVVVAAVAERPHTANFCFRCHSERGKATQGTKLLRTSCARFPKGDTDSTAANAAAVTTAGCVVAAAAAVVVAVQGNGNNNFCDSSGSSIGKVP